MLLGAPDRGVSSALRLRTARCSPYSGQLHVAPDRKLHVALGPPGQLHLYWSGRAPAGRGRVACTTPRGRTSRISSQIYPIAAADEPKEEAAGSVPYVRAPRLSSLTEPFRRPVKVRNLVMRCGGPFGPRFVLRFMQAVGYPFAKSRLSSPVGTAESGGQHASALVGTTSSIGKVSPPPRCVLSRARPSAVFA